MKIWFHGTNQKNANSILENGFRVNTYFAKHLEDSIAFGGFHVFEVALDGIDNWQYLCPYHIPKDRIVAYTVFARETKLDNPNLRLEIFQSNQDDSIDGFVGKIGA